MGVTSGTGVVLGTGVGDGVIGGAGVQGGAAGPPPPPPAIVPVFAPGAASVTYQNSDTRIFGVGGWRTVPLNNYIAVGAQEYVEFTTNATDMGLGIFIAPQNTAVGTLSINDYLGNFGSSAGNGDDLRLIGGFSNSGVANFRLAAGNRYGIAVDMVTKRMRWYINGTVQAGYVDFTATNINTQYAYFAAAVFPRAAGAAYMDVLPSDDATIPDGYTYHGA